jgi:Fumarylacetoacetate (FAA) hydrolase family
MRDGISFPLHILQEFIGSGTVGNGCGLELGRYLEHGDTVELEVERIGVLKNKVERQDVRRGRTPDPTTGKSARKRTWPDD